MEFILTEEQLMIQAAARDFAQNVLKPGVIERDTNMTHPTEFVEQTEQEWIPSHMLWQ